MSLPVYFSPISAKTPSHIYTLLIQRKRAVDSKPIPSIPVLGKGSRSHGVRCTLCMYVIAVHLSSIFLTICSNQFNDKKEPLISIFKAFFSDIETSLAMCLFLLRKQFFCFCGRTDSNGREHAAQEKANAHHYLIQLSAYIVLEIKLIGMLNGIVNMSFPIFRW